MKKWIGLALVFGACQPQVSIPTVIANVETEKVLAQVDADAADDPALWLNSAQPDSSFILGSNKTYGLEVYGLDGTRLANYPTGKINNIDVANGVKLGDSLIAIVAGSNRDYDRIDVWSIAKNARDFKLISDTNMRTTLEGVYGFCLWNDTVGQLTYAFVNNKDGQVEQWRLLTDSLPVTMELVRSFSAAGQVEGMVVDTESRLLYLGEEQGGVFAYALDDSTMDRFRIPLSGEENPDLAYDIEGITIYSTNESKYLLTSSQGNNRYAVYDINRAYLYLGVFQVGKGTSIDGAEETDGIDVYSGAFGTAYPKGVFVCQDGYNKDEKGESISQNFKIIDWRTIKKAMNLP